MTATPDPHPSHAPAGSAEPHILLVEDDEVIRNTVRMALQRYGFTVSTAADGLTGLEVFRDAHPDLLLLDVMLPELDGIGLCRRVREYSLAPILMMSARGDDLDVISGLEAGADDYVIKPCESAVLVARIRSLLRRASFTPVRKQAAAAARPGAYGPQGSYGTQGAYGPQGAYGNGTRHAPQPPDPGSPPVPDTVTFGELSIDTRGMEVRRAGEPVALTPTELRLLLAFAASPGVVLERRTLLNRVWDHAWDGDTRVVDLHVQRLRAKIGAERIETVRGFGYKLRR
jgi:two-component system response regulator MtrA